MNRPYRDNRVVKDREQRQKKRAEKLQKMKEERRKKVKEEILTPPPIFEEVEDA